MDETTQASGPATALSRSPDDRADAAITERWRVALVIGGLTLVLLQGIMLASHLAGMAIMLPSWASSVALIVGCREIPSARPRAACLGHLVCGAVGVAAVWLAVTVAGPLTPSWAMGLAASAVAAAVPVMWSLRCFHPPAAANAAIPFFTAMTLPVYTAAVILGAVLLFGAARALDWLWPAQRGGDAV